MPEEWIYITYPSAEERKNYLEKNFIPDMALGLDNFESFLSEREQILKNEFKKKLNILISAT